MRWIAGWSEVSDLEKVSPEEEVAVRAMFRMAEVASGSPGMLTLKDLLDGMDRAREIGVQRRTEFRNPDDSLVRFLRDQLLRQDGLGLVHRGPVEGVARLAGIKIVLDPNVPPGKWGVRKGDGEIEWHDEEEDGRWVP